ncbi:MAG: hypothetical protein ACRDCJ_02355 [Metamycoplasmataceae bacterium]
MNYKQLSKITIYSIITMVFAIVGILVFSFDYPNWIKYDSSFLVDPVEWTNVSEQLLPMSVQSARLWQAFSLVICIVMIMMTCWEIKKMEKTEYKKYYLASLGVFTWLMLPYTIYIGMKEKAYIKFLDYNSQDREEELQMSFESFKNGISGSGRKDKLFWNTIFGYLVLLVTLISTIFCFLNFNSLFGIEKLNPIDPDILKPGFTVQDYYATLRSQVIFGPLSTFTSLGNYTCFLFMLGFSLFSRKIAFRNNTIMILVASYIFVVLAIYWGYLFPQSLQNNEYVILFQWVRTSWTHAVVPFLVIGFTITSILISKSKPTNFKSLTLKGIPFPLFYGIYIYSIPFYTRWSVYGGLTNMNPNMDTSVGIEGVTKTGNPLMIIAFLGLAALFVFVFFCFWSLAYLVNKKEMNKMKVVL